MLRTPKNVEIKAYKIDVVEHAIPTEGADEEFQEPNPVEDFQEPSPEPEPEPETETQP